MSFHPTHPVIFIGGRKGGPGKSLLAHILMASVLADRVDRPRATPRDWEEHGWPKAGSRRTRPKRGRKRG